MKNPKINESLIIGVDFSKRDDGVLIVGRQKNGEVTIINAFQGKEAFDIYEKLITVKKGGGNDGAVKTSHSQIYGPEHNTVQDTDEFGKR